MSEAQLLKSIIEELRFIKTDFRNLRDDVTTKLEVLCNNTNKAAARTLEFKMNTNAQEFEIYPPVEVNDGEYGLGLSNFSVYHSIHNVDASNNLFKYMTRGDSTWQEFRLTPGSYEIEDINDAIREHVGDWIYIQANINTSKCEIFLDENKIVDFTSESIGTILGFKSSDMEYTFGTGTTLANAPAISTLIGQLFPNDGLSLSLEEPYKDKYKIISPNVINISSIDKVHMKCNMIHGSTINGRPSNILFSFLIDQSPGYLIFKEPNPISYKKVEKRETISSIRFSFEDDDGKSVNFNGETITFSLELKKM